MSLFSFTPLRKLFNTPIAHAEAVFHQRAIRTRAHRTVRMLMIVFLVILAASLAIALTSRPPVLPETFQLPSSLGELIQGRLQQLSTFILVWIAGVQYLLAMGLAAQSGVGSILHEKRSQTWESLILTGVDARQMVIGKWIGTLRTMWTVYGSLLLPRAAAMVWFVFASMYPMLIHDVPNVFVPAMLTSAMLAVVFPLASLALIAALGVLASLIGRGEMLSRAIASGLIIVSIIVLYVLAGLFLLLPIDSSWAPAMMSMPFALFDGGVITMFVLTDATVRDVFGLQFVAAGGLYVMALGALLWVVLRIAQWVAVRQNVSAPD